MKVNKPYLLIAFIFLLPRLLFSIPADVEDIADRAYFPAVLKSIQEAQKSIYACLYYISYAPGEDSHTNQLLQALIDARKRNLPVEVLLDRGFESASADMSKKNVRAYSYLRKAGVSVFYDDVKTLTHAKYWIMDEKLLILGSFNLSDKSLNENREAAVLIQSPELASQYLKHFQAIPKTNPEPVKDAIPIPREFIRDKSFAAQMVGRSDDRGFDFYLLAQKKSFEGKSATLEITEDEIFQTFYKAHPLKLNGKDYIQKFMETQIRFYKKKYPYLESYRRDAERKVLIVQMKQENKGDTDSLYLSKLYWEDAWDRRLTQKAKYSLLYMLDKTDSGRAGRYFEESRRDAVKESGVNHTLFAYGFQELQRYNLIEKDINWTEGGKTPNGYILNEFYRYEDFQNALKKLESETDPVLFKNAMEIADLVDEPSDLNAIRQIVELGKKHGNPALESTLQKIRNKGGLSRYRRLRYVLATIQGIAEDMKETQNEEESAENEN